MDPPDRPENTYNIFSVAIKVLTPTIMVGSTLQSCPLQNL